MAIRTPMKAIRAKCIDCCCGDMKEIRECTIEKCPLWPYRMGHRPEKDESIDKEVSSSKTPKKVGVNRPNTA